MRTYLDHASTSPLRPVAREATDAYLDLVGGDPSRIHSEGSVARAALEAARQDVADRFGTRPRSVVFTSGATESIAMVAWGAARRLNSGAHSVLSAVEHSAVRAWAERGPCTTVGVDGAGRVDPDELVAAITDETTVVHCQLVNHEVGTVQPVESVREAVRGPLLHVDAAQGAGHAPIRFDESGVDLMSISGHKLGGPTGIGVLLVRRGLRLDPLSVGGDQERARRAGMEHVVGAVGLAAACSAADPVDEATAQRRLTDRVIDWIGDTGRELGVTLLGDPSSSGRAPHLVCIGFEGVEPQSVLIGLDAVGVSVHSGSSCSSEAFEPSPVLAAMGVDAEHSLRISVGWCSNDSDIDRLLEALPRVLTELRALKR